MSNLISKLSVAFMLLIVSAVSLQANNISAYYDAAYADEKQVQSKLEASGFNVLTTYSPAKKDYLKVIVFTNKELTTIASKKTRGFAAIQRVLVNNQAKTVRVTNPGYWLRGFMQKEFTAGSDKSTEDAITKALGALTPTKDVLAEESIAGYHFEGSMPSYTDMLVIKKGEGLAAKIKKNKLFEISLDNGSKLIGVKMSKTNEKFIETIGEENALLLPYTILVEDGKAYALHAKYYLAIAYPLLSLDKFMLISSVPGAIERKLKKSFK